MKTFKYFFLILTLSFLALSCGFKEPSSSLTFTLPLDLLKDEAESSTSDESSSSEDITYTLRISVWGNFENSPISQEWDFSSSDLKNATKKQYKMEKLPVNEKVEVCAFLFKNENGDKSLIYMSHDGNNKADTIFLCQEEHEITLTLYKLTDSKSDSGESGSGSDTGAEDSSEESEKLLENFVKVKGQTVTGAKNTYNYDGVFIKNRTVTLSDFYIAKYEVTQEEYSTVMSSKSVTVTDSEGKQAEYALEASPSLCTSSSTTYALKNQTDTERPVENITWYDAIYFCNAKSESDGLTPAYEIDVTEVSSHSSDTSTTGGTSSSTYHIKAATVELVENANGYRLPTEAEWEFAGRGGDPTGDDTQWTFSFSGANCAKDGNETSTYSKLYNSGLDNFGWYAYNNKTGTSTSGKQLEDANYSAIEEACGTHEVGKLGANSLGLYDMSGNVAEWCYDWYEDVTATAVSNPTGPASGTKKVRRGGSWYHAANQCTVCYRGLQVLPAEKDAYTGFRLVRSIPSASSGDESSASSAGGASSGDESTSGAAGTSE